MVIDVWIRIFWVPLRPLALSLQRPRCHHRPHPTPSVAFRPPFVLNVFVHQFGLYRFGVCACTRDGGALIGGGVNAGAGDAAQKYHHGRRPSLRPPHQPLQLPPSIFLWQHFSHQRPICHHGPYLSSIVAAVNAPLAAHLDPQHGKPVSEYP